MGPHPGEGFKRLKFETLFYFQLRYNKRQKQYVGGHCEEPEKYVRIQKLFQRRSNLLIRTLDTIRRLPRRNSVSPSLKFSDAPRNDGHEFGHALRNDGKDVNSCTSVSYTSHTGAILKNGRRDGQQAIARDNRQWATGKRQESATRCRKSMIDRKGDY